MGGLVFIYGNHHIIEGGVTPPSPLFNSLYNLFLPAMPVIATYLGVYVEELSSGVRSVAALPRSSTAFVGRALRGPTAL